jgi:hypothetical protein
MIYVFIYIYTRIIIYMVSYPFLFQVDLGRRPLVASSRLASAAPSCLDQNWGIPGMIPCFWSKITQYGAIKCYQYLPLKY